MFRNHREGTVAGPQGTGVAVVLVLLAGLALAGAAEAKEENLTVHLPAAPDLAPLKLQIEKLQPAAPAQLEATRCNATAAAGAFENIGVLLPADPLGRPRSDDALARVTLYRFDSSADAAAYIQCMLDARNRSSARGLVSPAPYGDRGVVAEDVKDSVTGASLLFTRGPYLVAVDALEELFPSDRAHALAKMVDERLAKAGPAKTPGFEAVAGLAGLAVAAWVRGRRARRG